MRVRAYLDRCDTGVIDGWAIDIDQPDKPVRLDILHAGEIVATLVADKRRPDLVDAGLTTANNGFSARYADLNIDLAPERLILHPRGSDVYLNISDRDQSEFSDHDPAIRDVLASVTRRQPLCVLHIGFEKTGSTSIQRFLRLYRDQLASYGYEIPLSLADHRENYDTLNHISVTGCAINIGRFPADFKSIFGLEDRESISRYRLERLRQYAEEIGSFPHDAKVILSNEHCQSRLTSLREIARLKSLLSAFFERVVIVAFIRPQYEVARGLYDSALRAGLYGMDQIPNYDDPARSDRALIHRDYFDFFKTLNMWSAVFGRDALRVKLYDGSGTGLGVVGAFLKELGITDIEASDLQRENRGFSNGSRALLEVINRSVSERNILLRADFHDWLFPLLASSGTSEPLQVSDNGSRDFQRTFQRSNDEIRQVWFQERGVLFEAERQMPMLQRQETKEFSAIDALVDLLIASRPG